MLSSTRLLRLGFLVLLALAVAVPAAAQDAAVPVTGLSGLSLRPYQFVFLAYALAWLLVLGWVVAVARRMARLERRLER
ncbi:MAG TPA: CcmD family protein [Longimicrobiales bacterium]|nr:CcmD family protein [Longimicrobiales bacterium]